MKIAVLSDSHDHIWNLEKVVKKITGKVDCYVHCGDLIAPFISQILNKSKAPGYICLGNNDEDHIAMKNVGGDKISWVSVGQQFGELEKDGRRIAYCHYPKLGNLLASTGDYHAVFYGHTHKAVNKKVGKTLLLNPGAICGITAGVIFGEKKKHDPASYAIYDTKTNSAEIVYIK